MYRSLVLLSLLAFSCQGNAATDEENFLLSDVNEQRNVLNEAKEWFMESVKSLKDEVQKGVDEVRTIQATLKTQGQSEIENRYAVSKDQLKLMAVPPECVTLGLTQLKELESNGVNNFLLCPNLTLASEDVVGIGFEAAKLTGQLLLTADELMNGFNSCWSWNPLKFVYCSFVWMKQSVVQSFRSFSYIRGFMSKVASLISDIKDQYNYCSNKSKGLADVHTVNVLHQVHKCSLKASR